MNVFCTTTNAIFVVIWLKFLVVIKELSDETAGRQETQVRGRRQMLATGFASPADRFVEKRLNIHDFVVKNATATFFFKVKSDMHKSSPFLPGDILIIDRSVNPVADAYAVGTKDGGFVLLHLVKPQGKLTGVDLSTNSPVTEEFAIWGVIIHFIRPLL